MRNKTEKWLKLTYPFIFICKIICKKYELDKFYHLIILKNISLKRLLIKLLIIK